MLFILYIKNKHLTLGENKMNTKFEEAKYINGAVTRMYSAEEITAIRNENTQRYNEIKEYLFCPECMQPKLMHNRCQSKQDYFSTYPRQFHVVGCSYECEKATKKILTYLGESKNLNNLHTRLQDCLLLFIKGQAVINNPCIISKQTDVQLLKQTTNTQNAYGKRYYIPRKRLTDCVDQSSIDDFKIFYDTAEFKWYEDEHGGYYPHRLNIYHNNRENLICSLRFSNNVYEHLPLEYRKFDDVYFRALIAFYTKLTIHTDSGTENRTYYEGIINYSLKITFLDILPID